MLKSTNKKTVGDHVFSYMIGESNERFLHINNHKTDCNSVLIKLDGLNEFIKESEAGIFTDTSEGIITYGGSTSLDIDLKEGTLINGMPVLQDATYTIKSGDVISYL